MERAFLWVWSGGFLGSGIEWKRGSILQKFRRVGAAVSVFREQFHVGTPLSDEVRVRVMGKITALRGGRA